MSENMKSVDADLIRIFQVVYDYLWDRWGVSVGLFRATFFLMSYGCVAIFDHLSGRSSYLFFLPIVAILLVVHHSEIRLQQHGLFERLNALSLSKHPDWMFRIWFLLVTLLVMIFINALSDRTTEQRVADFVANFLLAGYQWTLTVLIRERDEERFKERKLAFDTAR